VTPDVEAQREAAVGEALRVARGAESQRSVAKRAGVSPTQWRHMENGVRDNGVPVRASDKTLEAAALAVGIDPPALFTLAGRHYDGPIMQRSSDERTIDLRLSAVEADLAQVRADVARLLDDQGEPES